MNWEIDKAVGFCYGHRVHLQELDEEFSIDTLCKCRSLHGHEGLVKIFLGSIELNGQQMVVDFKMLNWLKQFVDTYLDHKFVVDKQDPLYHNFIPEDAELVPVNIKGVEAPVGYTVDLNGYANLDAEWSGSFFIVDFCPTSENLSKWMFDFTKEKMSRLAEVMRVDWHETPKSRASYRGEERE